MNILEKIVESTKIRVEHEKKSQIPYQYDGSRRKFAFEQALSSPDISFICEVKKASPSKGIIAEDFPYLQIAKEYESAGADAISVLTEPEYFLGNNKYLLDIRKSVDTPILRKDFIIDSFQIKQSYDMGADAILLICSILSPAQLSEYLEEAHGYGLSCLVEAHSQEETQIAVECGAKIIGVNNRNLSTFDVNTNNSISLRKLVPDDIIFISESGIKTAEDVELLRQNNINGVLIGETLMRAQDKKSALNILKGIET